MESMKKCNACGIYFPQPPQEMQRPLALRGKSLFYSHQDECPFCSKQLIVVKNKKVTKVWINEAEKFKALNTNQISSKIIFNEKLRG